MVFTRKTSAFLGMRALQDLVSDSMAIDMGSASTIIAVRGRGVVVDEPSLVAALCVHGVGHGFQELRWIVDIASASWHAPRPALAGAGGAGGALGRGLRPKRGAAAGARLLRLHPAGLDGG